MWGLIGKSNEDAHYKEVDARRAEWKERREQEARDDIAATQRALDYEPPVRVIKGKHNEFLEVGPRYGATLCVPLSLIQHVSIVYQSGSFYSGPARRNPSALARLVVEMASGAKHEVSVEVASADLLLDAVNKIWRAA